MADAPEHVEALAVGRRVCLCLPDETDREDFLRLVAASREHLARWAPAPEDAGDTGVGRWFDALLRANEEGRSRKMLVRRCRDRVLMGCMNLNEIVRGGFQCAFLGYWIGAPFAGRGYMGDALEAVLRLAFEREGLHRLEANIQPGNEPSRRLVQRAGFRYEGFSLRYLRIGGAWRDHQRWALTVEEWSGRA